MTKNFRPNLVKAEKTLMLGVIIFFHCILVGCPNTHTESFQTNIVSAVTPEQIAGNVDVSSSLSVTFTQNINSATVTTTSFYLKDNSNNIVVGTVSCGLYTATFTPTGPLSYQTVYTATLTTSVKTVDGLSNSRDYIWHFTTAVRGHSFTLKPAILIPTGSHPQAVAIGDVTGNGRNDVVLVTNFDFDPANDFKLFLFAQNNYGGLDSAKTFTILSNITYPPQTVAIGDMNGDGKNEVVIGNDRRNIEIFVQDGSGGLVSNSVITTFNSNYVNVADLNKDGLQDLVGLSWGDPSNPASQVVEVFLQSAGVLHTAGTYTVPNCGNNDLAIGDVNGDGRLDITVMNGQGLLSTCPSVNVLIQNIDGTLTNIASYNVGTALPWNTSHGLAVGDVTGDGRDDIVVTYGENSPFSYFEIFKQNAAGVLDQIISYPTFDIPAAVVVTDMNGDGKNDVVVHQNGTRSKIMVYLQNSDGTIGPERLYDLNASSQLHDPQVMAIGDINGDGLADIAVAGDQGLIILYHN